MGQDWKRTDAEQRAYGREMRSEDLNDGATRINANRDWIVPSLSQPQDSEFGNAVAKANALGIRGAAALEIIANQGVIVQSTDPIAQSRAIVRPQPRDRAEAKLWRDDAIQAIADITAQLNDVERQHRMEPRAYADWRYRAGKAIKANRYKLADMNAYLKASGLAEQAVNRENQAARQARKDATASGSPMPDGETKQQAHVARLEKAMQVMEQVTDPHNPRQLLYAARGVLIRLQQDGDIEEDEAALLQLISAYLSGDPYLANVTAQG